MELGLIGKVALVSAASRGLGKATAMALAQEGVRVVMAARGAAALEAAAAEIRQATGAEVLAVPTDVTQAEQIETLVKKVLETWGRIDILVNNAGGPRPGVFTDMGDQDWLDAVNLNLMSTIRLTRLVLPGMRERKWGRIINLTSISVKQPIPTIILSNTARAGVVAMAKTLAGQVAAEGITVNNVCPGTILTDRIRNLAKANAERSGQSVEQALAAMQASIPAGRIGKPEELGALVTFLASEKAAYITGATIQIDGGAYLGLL
jgi:3-oxoacyl-[acyl-carrier protein] reductase